MNENDSNHMTEMVNTEIAQKMLKQELLADTLKSDSQYQPIEVRKESVSTNVTSPGRSQEEEPEEEYEDSCCQCFTRLMRNCAIGIIFESLRSGILSSSE